MLKNFEKLATKSRVLADNAFSQMRQEVRARREEPWIDAGPSCKGCDAVDSRTGGADLICWRWRDPITDAPIDAADARALRGPCGVTGKFWSDGGYHSSVPVFGGRACEDCQNYVFDRGFALSFHVPRCSLFETEQGEFMPARLARAQEDLCGPIGTLFDAEPLPIPESYIITD